MTPDFLTAKPFAHRGLHGPLSGHVENSLSAFRAANDRGHGFELDVLLSQDGKAVVFHDVALKRLTGQPGTIQNFTTDQLSRIKLSGSDDVILTLKQTLEHSDRQFPVLIEIKGDQGQSDTIAQAVYQDIQNYSGPVAVMSFYPDIVRWFQKNAPDISRGLVATSIKDDDLPDEYFSPEQQISTLEDLAVDFIAYDIKALPNEVTEHCRTNEIPVLTWTVRTEKLRQKAVSHTDNIIYENLD
ncbi:MAG: glycerophosphodiester phosphodiesterase [Alphaproteobacteria bacterium]|nr:MAG: glycerophosphodiester phosphodiesterase [Alphaproteobacteria bacterium]